MNARALPAHASADWRDFVQLLKPRVMSLVIFTAVTGLLCARTPMNPVLAAIAVLCIALGAGGSAALNMGFEGDIDAIMRRTRARPVPAGRIQRADALGLGVVLSLFSVAVMGLATNWLAAGLLAFTIFFYAVVYTLWLKRRTPQNIVIGGLAGALPPAVGWAAASGTAPANAWLLVAIIFMWTPPHFWALSLFTTEDYAAAGVPMMPVVRGAPHTRLQIVVYSLILAPLALAPAFTGLGGWLYLAVAAIGGIAFVALAARLAAGPAQSDPARARNLFLFSIAYLFALFAALLVERAFDAPVMTLAILRGQMP
jgi:protoheme IX farnesyltransferase